MRTLVAAKHGEQQVELMKNCLRSVCERQIHARYHFQEARRLLKEQIDDRLPNECIYSITLPTAPEARNDLDNCFTKVEAHVIACTQAIHSIADNLAHVAYFALGINRGCHALRDRDVAIQKVISVLESHLPDSSHVVGPLRALANEPAFATVEAFVNTTKHRGFPGTRLNVAAPGGHKPYAFEFGAFEYRDVVRPESDIDDVLVPSYTAASEAVVSVVNALNSALLSP